MFTSCLHIYIIDDDSKTVDIEEFVEIIKWQKKNLRGKKQGVSVYKLIRPYCSQTMSMLLSPCNCEVV